LQCMMMKTSWLMVAILARGGLRFARPWQCDHLSPCELSDLRKILGLVLQWTFCNSLTHVTFRWFFTPKKWLLCINASPKPFYYSQTNIIFTIINPKPIMQYMGGTSLKTSPPTMK
jgi:hypothetical protein